MVWLASQPFPGDSSGTPCVGLVSVGLVSVGLVSVGLVSEIGNCVLCVFFPFHLIFWCMQPHFG